MAAFRAAALAAALMTMAFRDDGLHRGVRRARDLFIFCGNCGFGFDCEVYDPGYGDGGGAGNAVTSSGDCSSGGGYGECPESCARGRVSIKF